MSQTFDITKPISGTTKLSQLYQIIRDHDQANRSSFSGATAPSTPVVGQLWEDTVNDKLFLYTAASGWSEVAVENIGLGLELKTARGSHSSLDSRLDAQLNEDGTLKAATTLNPSQWYDLTVASGYISTTSFRAYGADYTTVYYPTRRLKVNTPGAVYTEVVSSSYSAPNTTVVTRDAVVTAGLVSVSHSIVGPRKASAGDGAVSYEMVANRNVASPVAEYTVLVGDSVVMASGTFTVHGIAGGTFGPGRPLLVANIGTGVITYDPGAYSVNGSTTDLTLAAGQTLLIYPSGDNWRRGDQPVDSGYIDFSSTAAPSGWSSIVSSYFRYLKSGRLVHVQFYVTGTSNHAVTYFTLPTGTVTPGFNWSACSIRVTDNGTESTTPGMGMIFNATGSPNYIGLYRDWHGLGWTNSGTKVVSGSFTYISDL